MSLATFSVKRPIFTTMATLLVVILGIVSLSRLRIDLLPEIELPTVSVVTSYEGASPEVVERLVTQVLEEIISTVPGIEEITSQSSEGRSSIRVTFAWGTDIATAALDVQSTIEDQIRRLPEDALRPQVRKFDIASFPVVILGISSDLDPVEMTELIEDQIRYRFSRIPGVAQVDLWGGFNREVRVELDPERIKALELPLDQILSSIRAANLDRPAGRIDRGRLEITLRAPGEFESLDDIRTTVVAVRNGAAVTLGQISEVLDTYTKITRHVRVNGRRGVRIAIRKEADANTVEVSRRVLAEVDEINDSMPQVQIVPVIDQGDFIERSIRNVADSVLYGGSLAILVLLFFLRNIRSTIVISLAIPISIIATFALMYFGGFTLNLMTLGGLAHIDPQFPSLNLNQRISARYRRCAAAFGYAPLRWTTIWSHRDPPGLPQLDRDRDLSAGPARVRGVHLFPHLAAPHRSPRSTACRLSRKRRAAATPRHASRFRQVEACPLRRVLPECARCRHLPLATGFYEQVPGECCECARGSPQWSSRGYGCPDSRGYSAYDRLCQHEPQG